MRPDIDNYSTVQFDNFNRESLGSKWTIYNGNVGIVSKGELGILSKVPELAGMGLASWTGTNLASDQFCEATLSQNVDPRAICQVFTRRRKSDKARYGFYCLAIDEYGRQLDRPIWGLKLDGLPGGEVLASTQGPCLVPGDILRIEVLGNVIRGFHNQDELLCIKDATLTEPGEPGVVMNVFWVNNFPSPFYSHWKCGNLTSVAQVK